MDFEAIDELEGKFEYLKKHKEDPKKLEPLSGDYIKYLGANKPLARVVRKLALNDEIPVPVLKGIFGSFMVPQMTNLFKQISYPPFWDDIVEEKFHLQSDFQKFFLNLNERIYKGGGRNHSKDEIQWAVEAYPVLDFRVIEELHGKILEKIRKQERSAIVKKGNYLKSIHLITETLNPTSVIFLVLDERYEAPVRCAAYKKGCATYIKKLYDIAYLVNTPNKKVDYKESLSDAINNAPFRRRAIVTYMKTNKLKKPTLVQKAEYANILVLKGDILIKTLLIKNIPTQYQSLYTDKIN